MNLEGLTVCFLGDSITEGCGVRNIAANRYDNVLKELCALKTVHNYGIGGTRIAHQFQPSEEARWDLHFCGRAEKMELDADVVVVFGGTNDYGHGDAPFGALGDTDRGTYCGAVHWLMKRLVEMYPDKVIVFMTPARRVGDANASERPCKQGTGRPLKAYAEVICQTAKAFPVQVLDLYEQLGIDPNLQADRERYAPDGLHLNDEGHRILAGKLQTFLQTI